MRIPRSLVFRSGCLRSLFKTPRCRPWFSPGPSLALVVVSLGMLGACHHGEEPPRGIVTLLDEVGDQVPAGPWRLLPLSGHPGGTVARLPEGEPSRRFSKVGTLEFGGLLLVRLAYRHAPEGSVTAEVRLFRQGKVVAGGSQRLVQSWAELRLPIPEGGADEIEIGRRGEAGSEIPPAKALALEVHHPAGRILQRASHLLAWAIRADPEQARHVLEKRKVRLARRGEHREAIPVLCGEVVTFAVPREEARWRLRCWPLPLRRVSSDEGVLIAEVEGKEGWQEVGRWETRRLLEDEWEFVESAPFRGWKVRLTLEGEEDLIALASPILVPHGQGGRVRPNVLLIDLDTMRADRLGCYGYRARPTSARLDSILEARGFFLFERAHSGGPCTLPATAKFLTSRYLNIDRGSSVPLEYTTLAELLRANGFYCAAFTGGGTLCLPGFEQGFHSYYWSEEVGGGYGKVEDSFPQAISWLAHTDLRPFFLFVHTYEPHMPYTRATFCRDLPSGRLGDLSRGEPIGIRSAEGKDGRAGFTPAESLYLQAAYDGGVRMACEATADILAVLDDRGLWEHTIVVILSDHGEEFGEHSVVFADHNEETLHGEVLSVPFLLYDPAHARSGLTRIEEDVSTVDLLPTLAHLLGITPPACDGVSLVPLLEGGEVEREVPILATNHPGEDPARVRSAVIEGGLKYIGPDIARQYARGWYAPGEMLFDLRCDPAETRNLVEAEADERARMAALLAHGLSTAAPPLVSEGMTPPHLSEEVRARLRLLGYVAPDPKE